MQIIFVKIVLIIPIFLILSTIHHFVHLSIGLSLYTDFVDPI